MNTFSTIITYINRQDYRDGQVEYSYRLDHKRKQNLGPHPGTGNDIIVNSGWHRAGKVSTLEEVYQAYVDLNKEFEDEGFRQIPW